MKIKLFREFNSIAQVCQKCGEEYWEDQDYCNDCCDTDLEEKEIKKPDSKVKQELPIFGVPTPRSQNIYYW
jgi:hypothetical protein